jgi:hypothetical protein
MRLKMTRATRLIGIATIAMTAIVAIVSAAHAEIKADPTKISVVVGGSGTSTITHYRTDDPRTAEEAYNAGDPVYNWSVTATTGTLASPIPEHSGTVTLTAGRTSAGTGTVTVHVEITWPCAPGTGTELYTSDNVDVTVVTVEIEKIQWENEGTWTNVTEPLYVVKGTTLSFKPIPNPSDAAWPTGKPVWGGTAGASGPGDPDNTKKVTFNEAGSKTVTAECGNTVTVTVVCVEVAKI